MNVFEFMDKLDSVMQEIKNLGFYRKIPLITVFDSESGTEMTVVDIKMEVTEDGSSKIFASIKTERESVVKDAA